MWFRGGKHSLAAILIDGRFPSVGGLYRRAHFNGKLWGVAWAGRWKAHLPQCAVQHWQKITSVSKAAGVGLERSSKIASGNVTDGWHSGDERPCNSTLLGRVKEKKAEDGWPGEESSSQGRDLLPSSFTQSWAEPRIFHVNGSYWLLVKLWSAEGPCHQG